MHVFEFVADDECESNPCANKGTCTIAQKGSPGYRCACRTGYIGLTCTGRDVLRTNIDRRSHARMHSCRLVKIIDTCKQFHKNINASQHGSFALVS